MEGGENKKPPPAMFGTLAFADFSKEDYEAQYWPLLKDAVLELLTVPPDKLVPMSYEKVYSCVYRCVCKQFAKQLHLDLIHFISVHLQQVSTDIQCDTNHNVVQKFADALRQYTYALSGIVPIFTYLNKYYIQLKLNSNLESELKNMFMSVVCDRHIRSIIDALLEASRQPFLIHPSTASEVVQSLYQLNPGYVHLHPLLFAKYLPGVLEASNPDNLNAYIEEQRQQEKELLLHPDFCRGDQSRKRRFDDDM